MRRPPIRRARSGVPSLHPALVAGVFVARVGSVAPCGVGRSRVPWTPNSINDCIRRRHHRSGRRDQGGDPPHARPGGYQGPEDKSWKCFGGKTIGKISEVTGCCEEANRSALRDWGYQPKFAWAKQNTPG